MLKDTQGEFAKSPMEKVFSNIFSTPPKWSPEITKAKAMIARCRQKIVAPSMDAQLAAPFSTSEIQETIKKLKRGKSPGYDGLPYEFTLLLIPQAFIYINHNKVRHN